MAAVYYFAQQFCNKAHWLAYVIYIMGLILSANICGVIIYFFEHTVL